MITINEINSYILETVTIPWRSGIVPVEFITLSIKGDTFYGLAVNSLKQYFSFIPSFVAAVPNKKFFVSGKIGESDNVYIIPAIIVNTIGLSFTTLGEGECELQFHWFSSDKQDWRQFDLLHRFFEREIRLIDIAGIKELEGKSFSITIKKRYYNVQTIIRGDVKGGIFPFRRRRTEEAIEQFMNDPTRLLEMFPGRIKVLDDGKNTGVES